MGACVRVRLERPSIVGLKLAPHDDWKQPALTQHVPSAFIVLDKPAQPAARVVHVVVSRNDEGIWIGSQRRNDSVHPEPSSMRQFFTIPALRRMRPIATTFMRRWMRRVTGTALSPCKLSILSGLHCSLPGYFRTTCDLARLSDTSTRAAGFSPRTFSRRQG